MSRNYIYLAHPFNSRTKIKKFGDKLQKKLKRVRIVNPFYNEHTHEVFTKSDKSNADYYAKLNSKSIVESCLALISHSDYMVAVIDGALSYGTIQEIVYANLWKIPVFIVCTNGQSEHPWLQYHASEMFTSYKALEEFLANAEL